MFVRSFRGFMMLVLVFMLVFALVGCGNGAEEAAPAPDEPESETDAVEEPAGDEPEEADRVADLDISGLWAPPITPSPSYEYPFDVENLVSNLPQKGQVQVPLYPGAYALDHGEAQHGRLPQVYLLSSDPPETVIAFYQEQLEGEGWELSHNLLWPSDAGSSSDAYGHLIPSIEVLEADEFEIEFMTEAKSSIKVVYEP